MTGTPAGSAGGEDLQGLMARAIDRSPIRGLMHYVQKSRFTLCHNGRRIDTGSVAEIEGEALADPGDGFAKAAIDERTASHPFVHKLAEGERREGVKHGVRSSLKERQSRTLHIQGVCTLGDDGVRKRLSAYRIVQDALFSLGSATATDPRAVGADPVETHVHLDTLEDDSFSRTALDMASRPVFLHAFCRTPLQTKFQVIEL